MGALNTLSQRVQEPADMGRMVADAERAADDLGGPLAGPDLATKPVRLGPALQQGGELGQLRGAERGSGTGGRTPDAAVARPRPARAHV